MPLRSGHQSDVSERPGDTGNFPKLTLELLAKPASHPKPLDQSSPRRCLSIDLGPLSCRKKAGSRNRACRWAVPTSSSIPSQTGAALRARLSSAFSCGARTRLTTCPSSWSATKPTWPAAGKSPWKVSPTCHWLSQHLLHALPLGMACPSPVQQPIPAPSLSRPSCPGVASPP